MGAKKSSRIIKKAVKKSASRPTRSAKSRYVSFFIGVVTVVAIAFMIFQYAQSNNYKTVLGEKTQLPQQDLK